MARAVVHPLATHVQVVVIFSARQRANVLRVSNGDVGLTNGCQIRNDSRVRIRAATAAQVNGRCAYDRRYRNLFAAFIQPRSHRLVLCQDVVKYVGLGDR